MHWKIRVLVLSLLAGFGLIATAIWAGLQTPITTSIADVLDNPAAGNNPWLIASLLDAYFGFLWFWAWVAYREHSWAMRLLWLLLILLGGNITMAIYAMIALARVPAGAGMPGFLLGARHAR